MNRNYIPLPPSAIMACSGTALLFIVKDIKLQYSQSVGKAACVSPSLDDVSYKVITA
jgi:hypothetical protein